MCEVEAALCDGDELNVLLLRGLGEASEPGLLSTTGGSALGCGESERVLERVSEVKVPEDGEERRDGEGGDVVDRGINLS